MSARVVTMDHASKDARDARKEARRRKKSADAVPGSFGKFALFAEVLLTGVYVIVLSLAVVTALPAVTAGVRHLRRHLRGERDGVAELWADFKDACSGVWLVALGSMVVFFLVALNLWAVSTGALPGGAFVGAVSAALGVALSVGLLRAAGSWSPGERWFPLVRTGMRDIAEDPAGSVLLFTAVIMCAVLVWMLKPLVIIVGGLIAFAVVGVGFRTSRPRP